MVLELDQYLFHQGTHTKAYEFMGAHFNKSTNSTTFRVHAPNADGVSVACDENGWTGKGFELQKVSKEGLYEGTFPLIEGTNYKYCIEANGHHFLKADPYAQYAQKRPLNASIIYTSNYQWKDAKWMKQRNKKLPYDQPINIYEIHLGTFKKHDVDEHLKDEISIDEYTDKTYLTYREMADVIIPYVKSMHYTHIELLPITEHPFDLSWGYQVTGFFAPTSRFGTPDDFKYFIDQCHQHQIGVILDWVPAHFNRDDHGLRLFDGSPLFEPSDQKMADKRGWGTLSFDFSKPEVNTFLISSAMYFVNEFHIDGIRVDAVHSMIDLNFENHAPHEKIYNPDGSEDNKPAISFLQNLSCAIFQASDSFLLIAEDSSDTPMITAPVDQGGLGFNFKWDLGFMHDTLDYFESNHRNEVHQKLTFPMMYRYNENYILPYSHDEVVHGKKSMLDKMPGDQWRKFAQYRLLYGHQLTFPGKKLNFMGSEIGMYSEWKDKEQVDWFLLKYPIHIGLHDYIKTLNKIYVREKALFEKDFDPEGFQWIDVNNAEQQVISYIRQSKRDALIVILNFSDQVYYDFKIGVNVPGKYRVLMNSDLKQYGGSHQTMSGYLFTAPGLMHGRQQYLSLKIPPFGMLILKKVKEKHMDKG